MTKRMIAFALPMIVLVSLLSGCGKSDLKDTPPEVKFYQVKSAKIVYDYTGAAKGTRTHYLANYGMYQSMEDQVTFSMGGQSNNVHTMNITDDSTSYVIDLVKKTGMKSKIQFDMLKEFTKNYTQQQKDNFQMEYLLQSGAVKVGKETILGKECDILDVKTMGMKHWIWKGLTLKSEFNMGAGLMSIVAKSIDVDITPKAEWFAPPKDITISDHQNMPKPQGQQPNPHAE
jgi:hypothetical protein